MTGRAGTCVRRRVRDAGRATLFPVESADPTGSSPPESEATSITITPSIASEVVFSASEKLVLIGNNTVYCLSNIASETDCLVC